MSFHASAYISLFCSRLVARTLVFSREDIRLFLPRPYRVYTIKTSEGNAHIYDARQAIETAHIRMVKVGDVQNVKPDAVLKLVWK